MPPAHHPARTNALNPLAGAALVAALLAGCASPGARAGAAAHPDVAPTATSAPTPEPTTAWAPDATDEWQVPEPVVPEGRRDRFRKDWYPGTSNPTLAKWLWYAVDPPGRPADIALRFAQALQQHDDFAAGLELASRTRDALNYLEDATLHELMANIREHAGLGGAPRCTSARDLDRDSALVTCGRTLVVVHLDAMLSPGVLISEWWTHEDVFRGPHTHAFTTLDF